MIKHKLLMLYLGIVKKYDFLNKLALDVINQIVNPCKAVGFHRCSTVRYSAVHTDNFAGSKTRRFMHCFLVEA